MATPPAPQNSSLWKISLPQTDGPGERVERIAQLEITRLGYNYDPNNSSLPMPMGTDEAAGLEFALLLSERPLTSDWVAGQLENQTAILVDLAIWQILRSLSAKTITTNEAATEIAKLQEKVPPPPPFGRTWDSFKAIFKQPPPAPPPPEPLPSLSSYAGVFTIFPIPDIVQQWEADRVFASQRLAGLNPMIIQRVTADGSPGANWAELRKKLSSTIGDAALEPFFSPPITLDQAVSEKRLFVADYKELGAVTGDQNAPGWQKGLKIQAPVALYVRTNDYRNDDFPGLHLVAVQLDQGAAGGDSFAVMLAADAGKQNQANNWLLAKICVQAADLSYNQAVNHLGQTHLIEEAFVLTTRRQLAVQHPLNVLLSRHFSALLVINAIGSLTLLKPGPTGLINQLLAPGLDGSLELIRNRYENWSFDQLDFLNEIDSRGLRDLPAYFPYRDDGREIWKLLGDYAKEYIGLYYLSDSDVTGDYELQAWAGELGGNNGGHYKVPGFKPSIATIEELIPIIQKLLWTASAQHAAVNFPQVEYASFIPNYPGATYKAPPAGFPGRGTTEQDLLETLAPVPNMQAQFSTAYALARYHYDALLDYSATLKDPKAAAVCLKYYNMLRNDICKKIEDRNAWRAKTKGLLPYPYFLPANIPNSTSV
jgi:arachidonate 15-lipoxygenase